MQAQTHQQILDILSQGPELNREAGAQTGDLNESHLLVHGVIARALRAGAKRSNDEDLGFALATSLDRWRACGAACCR